MKADRSFIYNSSKIETSQRSLKGRMDKQIVVYSDNGTLVSNKMNELLTHTMGV